MAEQHDLDIVGLVEVAGRPVTIAEIAATLGLEQSPVVTAIERLAGEQILADTPKGVTRGTADFEVSSARSAMLAGQWADGLISAGADPLAIGEALQRAGRTAEASGYFVRAATAGGPDAGRASSAALEAGGLDGEIEGRMRLIRARHYRGIGRSADAAADLEVAVRRLAGPEQVDAVGFAAAVADDRQHPAESGTHAALGAGLANDIGEPAKEGSLLTLLGRSLNRTGFPGEADASHSKGQALLEAHGAPIQRFLGRMNEAWIHFDRGEMRQAEAIFSSLRDRAMELEGEVSLADKEAYWARSLFGIGHISEGFAAQGRALLLASKTKAIAVEFIASMAGVEGSLAVGDDAKALEWADRALALSREHLPAWENGMLALRAKALAAKGSLDEARADLEAALQLCPAGSDGWRWRLTIRALQMALTPESDTWPRGEAEDLTDELLQARLYGVAVDLMTARSAREKDPELGEQAAALALQLGNPNQAAAAAKAADLWKTPLAGGVARAVAAAESHIPSEHGTRWRAQPGIGEALAIEATGDPEGELLQQRIDDALRTAGLAGVDVVLSPAQRRAGGLVRRRRRRPTIARTIAAALGVVALTVVTVLVLGNFNGGGTTETTAEPRVNVPDLVGLTEADARERIGSDLVLAVSTVTTIVSDDLDGTVAGQTPPAGTTLQPGETVTVVLGFDDIIDGPAELFGSMEHRGGPARTGQAPVGPTEVGFRSLLGKYWRKSPGGDITNSMTAFGTLLYVATENPSQMVAINQSTGNVEFVVPLSDDLRAPGTVSQFGEVTYLAFGTGGGRVYATNARRSSGTNLWEADIGPTNHAGIIDGQAFYLGTTDGRLLALALEDRGSEIWSYTGTETAPLAAVDTAPTLSNGVLYIADRDRQVHMVNVADGTAFCEPYEANAEVVGNVIIEDGVVYVPVRTGIVQMFAEGTCGAQPEGRAFQIFNTVDVQQPPAVAGGIVFVNEVSRLTAWDSRTGDLTVWPVPFEAGLGDRINTPPVVAEGVVYFGTQSGFVYAVDAATGEELWRYEVGQPILGNLVVVPRAVYASTADQIIAIGGE